MIETDVLIVGAGPAGLLMGEVLAKAGVPCTILEAGPFVTARRTFRRAALLNQHPELSEWESRLVGVSDVAGKLPGAWTRVRAVGGRSLLWGGCAERFGPDTFSDAQLMGAPWPVTLEELEPHYALAERLFGVTQGPGRLTGIDALGIESKARRTALHGGRVRTAVSLSRGKQRVVPNAIVQRILWTKDGVAKGVEYLDVKGRRQRAKAKAVVLCASPVESIRLLLADPPEGIVERRHLIGRGVTDHLVVNYVAIAPLTVKKSSREAIDTATFIPRFVNVPGSESRGYVGGFSMEAYGPVEARRLDPGWLPMLKLSPREARTRSFFTVSALGDAIPHQDRFIELHARDKDGLGRPVPVVHQKATENDQAMAEDMLESTLAVIDAITPEGSVIVPFRDPRRHRALFHESGGLVMGRDPKTSVTDSFGQVRGVKGLYVADASTFPTSGDRHPTLTILALASRTAHHLIEAGRRREL